MNAENIYKCVCQVDAQSNGGGGRGTGFFYKKNDINYLVTNQHVLHDRTVLTLRLRLIEKDTLQQCTGIGKMPIITERLIECQDTDIAAYPINELIDDYEKKGCQLDYYFINQSYIVSELEKLQWIEEIVAIGYPMNLTDEGTYYPMSFKGITTTPIIRKLDGKPDFLIDCNISKGGSGSPVFIEKNGTYKLVGIVYGNIRCESYIQNVNVENNYHVDLLTCQKDTLSIATVFNTLNNML